MTLQPRNEGETFSSSRVSPAAAYARSLGEGYYLLSEVAKMVGVAPGTLRRLVTDPDSKFKAPSFTGHQGKMPIYIFTNEDVAEISKHYAARYEGFERRDLERTPGRPRDKKVS